MFYRKASRSLRSRNTLRLFTFLKLRFWLLFRCSQIHNPNQDSKSKPHIIKNQKFPKNTDVLARSHWEVKISCVFCISTQCEISNIAVKPAERGGAEVLRRPRESRGLASPLCTFLVLFSYKRKKYISLPIPMGVERVRTPSAYFFGTFFVRAKKVRQCAAPNFAGEQAKTSIFIYRENRLVFVP